MERDDHIHLIHAVIIRDVAGKERKLVITVLFCQPAAVPDHILLQIQPDNADIIAFQLMQIIIHGKCKIRLSAPEVKDRKFPVPVKLRQDILDKLKEPVDLPELVRPRPDDLPVLRHHSEITEKRYEFPFFENVSLLPVVGQVRRLRLLSALLPLDRGLPFFADQHRILRIRRLDLHLPELPGAAGQLLHGRITVQIFVERLFRRKRLKLKDQLPFQLQRADLHFDDPAFLPRVADDRADEIFI